MRRARGFTLLEVLVALAVLAFGLMAVSDLAGTALSQHGYARDLTVATALARGKMAELEETYEDKGFKDFDETEEGDFADQGQPGFAWRVEVKKPDATLGPEQLLGVLLGQAAGDASTQELLQKLMGTGQGAGQGGGQAQGAPGGLLGGVLAAQLTAFGEQLKKSFRQVTLTVAWRDGRTRHQFDVTTHLVVLNPRAPGGARGASPDVPPNLQAATALPALPGAGGAGLPALPGVTGQPAAPRTGPVQ